MSIEIPNPRLLSPNMGLTDAELRAEPVDVHLREPGTGFHVRMTPIGDMRVVEAYRLVGTVFGSAIDTTAWTASNSGAGSAAGVASGLATLTSGTANSGYGQITTVRKARSIFAHPHQFRAAARLTATAVAETTRRVGPYSLSGTAPQNGFAFEFDQNGALTVKAYRNGSVSYSAASGAFNGEAASYAIDTNVHAYEILHFIMGAWFYIDGVLIHEILPTTAPMCDTLNTPCTAQCINSASGTTSAGFEIWSMNTARLGRAQTQPMTYYHAAATTAGVTVKAGPGVLRRAIVSQISNNAAVTIYDNTAASGTVLWTSGAMPANNTPYALDFGGIPFENGLTFVVATAAASIVWSYE